MSVLGAWRVPLRIARREAMRARGRSVLVLVMIALPVLAVTATAVVLRTQDVRGAEALDRRLGAASAKVTATEGAGHIFQGADPDQNSGSDGAKVPLTTQATVLDVLGDRPLVEARDTELRVESKDGVALGEGTELDLTDPVVAGLFVLDQGRLPRSADEVVVNQAMTEKGYAVGDTLDLAGDDAPSPRIVGLAESTTIRDYPLAVGPLGSLDLRHEGTVTWYAGGGPVRWDEVRELNNLGAGVLSRAVMLDPPSASEIPEEARSFQGGSDPAVVATIALVVVMALMEVVLLAGPAFAVGARRQARSLALMAATGGTPQQARRVVLGSAVVLGGAAALLGTGLGIAAAAVAVPVLQPLSRAWFGPFEVPWLQVLGIAAFGLLSAFLAAVVPAWIASRQDVVAVLAGRRGDRKPSRRSPLVGLLLLGLGIAGSAVGATRSGGETLIAGSAILAVLGMVLLVPVVVAVVSRLARRLPLTLRYAARDAARHRTRTVPAVAAVAATVAGVVALGIGNSSDAAENRETYRDALTLGSGVLVSYGVDTAEQWPALESAVAREIPGARVTRVSGLLGSSPDGSYLQLDVTDTQGAPLLDGYGGSLGGDVLVSDTTLPPGLTGISADDATRAAAALRSGGTVAFTDHGSGGTGRAVVTATQFDPTGDGKPISKETLPVTLVPVRSGEGAQLVLSTRVAEQLKLPVSQVGLVVDGATVTPDQESALNEAAQAISMDTSFYVERGYQQQDSDRIVLIVLAVLGAVLMLGGTLTATSLALSDARADLATLSAVGASPRTRRGVAASYALVIGVVGALLGAVVGFIPGIAITYPLTRANYDGTGTGPFLDVPWTLVLGLVVLLPLLTAAVVGVTARSRLPLVARLD